MALHRLHTDDQRAILAAIKRLIPGPGGPCSVFERLFHIPEPRKLGRTWHFSTNRLLLILRKQPQCNTEHFRPLPAPMLLLPPNMSKYLGDACSLLSLSRRCFYASSGLVNMSALSVSLLSIVLKPIAPSHWDHSPSTPDKPPDSTTQSITNGVQLWLRRAKQDDI